jgi:hypothetical protein
MKWLKIICPIVIVITFILMTSASCSPKKIPSLDYAGAIKKISTSATQLVVKEYTYPSRQVTLEKSSPEFNAIINYLEQSTLTRTQPRFVVQEGKKLEVAIPYSLNYVLVFTLSDGSEISFDYGGEVWFNTENMIYGASADAGLFDLLNQIFGKQ